MKSKPLFREAQIRAEAVDAKTRTLNISFSSETPVDRWFGSEILDHEPKSARLARLNSGAPLLFNHNSDDVIGVVESARIGDDRRGYATVRLARNARGEEVLGMVQDDVLRNVSFMYRVHEVMEKPKSDEFRVTDWEPMEISIVSVPADHSVGIGRTATQEETEIRVCRIESQPAPAISAINQGVNMSNENNAAAGASADVQVTNNGPDPKSIRQMETDRQAAIENLCRANKIDDGIRNQWVTSGANMRQVSEDVMRILEDRSKYAKPASEIGLSAREAGDFSFCRALLAVKDQNWTHAGFEAEASRAVAQKIGRTPDPMRFFVPWEVMSRATPVPQNMAGYSVGKRDLTVATAGAGGFLVETANVGFVDLLRNKSVLYNMGALRLSGLEGNVAIPKQSATGSPTWLANEAASISEINQTFVQIAMTPKQIGGYTEISRLLLLQANPSIEGVVRADLAAVVGLDIDLKGLNGSGASGQPTGILNTAGIGSVTGTSMDYADIVEFQSDVFASNALFAGSGYVTTGAVAGLLKTRVKAANTWSPIWEGRLDEGRIDEPNGYRGMASNQMPAATMLFGDFSQVVIGEWGVLEIEVNPFANFQAGIVGVRAIAAVDIAVRYATAFSAAGTIT